LAKLEPDLPADKIYQAAETYGIDEARQLKRWQAETTMGGERFLILSFRHITLEAQNALLKTLEEPTRGNHFFLITESTHGLLPTLLSRLQALNLGGQTGDDALDKLADKFLAAGYEARLQLVTKFLAAEERGASIAAAKASARHLVNVLTAKLERRLRDDPPNPKFNQSLATLLTMSDYLHDQAALSKMILEHLALVLPKP